MTLTIFPSCCAFVQKVTDYDEWTISLRKRSLEKKNAETWTGTFVLMQCLINFNMFNDCPLQENSSIGCLEELN